MPNKIKIIHIIPTLDMGGAERAVIDVVKNLDKDFFEVKVVCLKRIGRWGMELKKENIEIILLNQKDKLGLFVLPKLISIIRSEKPDIVHTHLFGGDLWGRLAARSAGARHIISTEHNLNHSEGRLKKILKKYTSSFAESIIASSEAIKDYAIKQEGIKEEKIQVIYYGVETEKFLNVNRAYSDKKELVIGSIGRLTAQKGLENLIGALAKIDSGRFICRIAGEGKLKAGLQKQIAEAGLEEKINLVGSVNDIKGFLDGLDIFVFPSRWEGLGIAILEAGLSGLPVVASDVDGIKEVVNNNKDGLLIKVDDSGQLAEKIIYLMDNTGKRREFGIELQKKVMAKFSIARMAEAYSLLYKKIILK